MQVLALVESVDHVCCRYRIRAFEPALRAAGCALTIEPVSTTPVGRARQFMRAAGFDVTILQRKLLAGWQWALLRRRARRVVFDFDDAILFRDSYDRRGPHSPRRLARFRRTVREADLILAGNEFLAECARECGARPERVRVQPTCVDTRLYPVKSHSGQSSNALDLVWVGSSSTLRGLEQSRALWTSLGHDVPGLRLRLICDRSASFEPLRVVAIPWSEHGETREIAAGDVGIGWMPDDVWSRGKCGLKVLQYQAAGLPVVANRVGIHSALVAHGVNGYLADAPAEWHEATARLFEPEQRAEMGRGARAAVESNYSVEAWARHFVAAVRGTSAPASKANPVGPEALSREGHARPTPARATAANALR
jgi:glycosyltransferase involved in cell wall biosynthesis